MSRWRRRSVPFTYLMIRPAVWDKLMDLLVLVNTLAPGLEMPGFSGPVSLDIVVNSLVMAFVLTGVGYLADRDGRFRHTHLRGLIDHHQIEPLQLLLFLEA